MGMPGFSVPYALGGGGYGSYRAAAQAAQRYSLAAGGAGLSGATPGGITWVNPDGSERTIEDAGITAGEIIGWRAWFLIGGYLRSMFVDSVWLPGEQMTGDPKTNGIHAFKTKRQVLETYIQQHERSPIVVGTVALWGEVIEHELGYRAEFGAVEKIDDIVSVHTAQDKQRLIAELSAKYATKELRVDGDAS